MARYLRKFRRNAKHKNQTVVPVYNPINIYRDDRTNKICVASIPKGIGGGFIRFEYDVAKYNAIPIMYRKQRSY